MESLLVGGDRRHGAPSKTGSSLGRLRGHASTHAMNGVERACVVGTTEQIISEVVAH